MTKRKLEDFKDDSQFRFWGIVISRFVWNKSRSEVAKAFSCSETYVTKVMSKFDDDGGYIDHRQFNKGQHVKEKVEIEKVVIRNIKKKPNISSVQIQEKVEEKVNINIGDRYIRNLREELGYCPVKTSLLPNLSDKNLKSKLEYCKKHLNDKFTNAILQMNPIFSYPLINNYFGIEEMKMRNLTWRSLRITKKL